MAGYREHCKLLNAEASWEVMVGGRGAENHVPEVRGGTSRTLPGWTSSREKLSKERKTKLLNKDRWALTESKGTSKRK